MSSSEAARSLIQAIFQRMVCDLITLMYCRDSSRFFRLSQRFQMRRSLTLKQVQLIVGVNIFDAKHDLRNYKEFFLSGTKRI
jgi:hypothetical protein